MTRGIILAGNESSLFSAIEAEVSRRVELYAAAVIPGLFNQPYAEGSSGQDNPEKGKAVLAWNPSSPLSARTVVLSAENRLGRIDEAVLVCWPPAFYRSAESLLPADSEKYVNDQIKSWFFLVRELAAYFKNQKAGSLALVFPDESFGVEKSLKSQDVNADLLGPSAASSFRSLAQGLISSSGTVLYRIFGFTGCNTGIEKEFASWLFKTIDEGGRKAAGRLHKYSKMSFFK